MSVQRTFMAGLFRALATGSVAPVAGEAAGSIPHRALHAGDEHRREAEGGAGQNPVLNICDRVPGGLAR